MSVRLVLRWRALATALVVALVVSVAAVSAAPDAASAPAEPLLPEPLPVGSPAPPSGEVV
jgi:hypothetical protein